MPDPDASFLLHAGTLVLSLAGMAWLALAMDVNARQVWGGALALAPARMLRVLGATALAASLLLALVADHASMAVLVWVMAVAASALGVAFTLAWRARWLRWLAPWTGRAGTAVPAHGPGSTRR